MRLRQSWIRGHVAPWAVGDPRSLCALGDCGPRVIVDPRSLCAPDCCGSKSNQGPDAIAGPRQRCAQGLCGHEAIVMRGRLALSLPLVHITVRGRDVVILAPSLIDPLSPLGNTPTGKRFASMASTHSQGVLKALLEKKKVTLAQSKRHLDQEHECQRGCTPYGPMQRQPKTLPINDLGSQEKSRCYNPVPGKM